MATAAESAWSNGVVERLNAVLGSSVDKIICQNKCSVKVALSWAVSARNALCTYTGFSPNQLVFGFNPALPNFANNKLPAMGGCLASDVVRTNLVAMHAAREEFVKMESNAKLQKAFSSNMRQTDAADIDIGDEVFYKRNESNEWKGPAKVIGRDGKQLIVKQGTIMCRVHVCRLTKCSPDKRKLPTIADDNSMCSDGNIPAKQISVDDAICECGEDQGVRVIENEEEIWYDTVNNNGEERRNEQVPAENNCVCTNNNEGDKLPIEHGKVILKTGQRVKGIHTATGAAFTGKVISRSGKATGMYRNCYNIRSDEDASEASYDVVRDFSTIEVVPDDTELLVLYNSDAIKEAKMRELQNWTNNEVFQEVEDGGQQAISVRWIVKEKIKEGKTVTKARLVARGFEEETLELNKNSPTCSKESIRLSVSLASSNGWEIKSLDFKSAFLQGDIIDREVFLIPPPEFNNGYLWKLKKTVYGLCDAARAWFLRVKGELLKIGVKMSTYDNGFFSYIQDGKVEGIVCLHVDDFLYAGTKKFEENVIDKISRIFCVGNEEKGMFKYVGLNVSSEKNAYNVDQMHYAASLRKIQISPARANNKQSELSKREKDEYRVTVGQLNWLATQTRPDIAFDICFLSAILNKATVGDILKINKLVDRVKNQCFKLSFPPMRKIGECFIECFSDASFGNLPDSGSQGGMIILLCDNDGKKCPIHWQSRKIRRVVKSTLAAETLALADCVDEAIHITGLISEILNIPMLKIYCYVDNRSLVDALKSSKPVDGKRLRIEMAVIKEMISKHEIESVTWIPTSSMIANCLTKGGASVKTLLQAISM